ncbi:Ankyrin repeat-containing domain protein [Naviculisporaceae sp. PSN 640]
MAYIGNTARLCQSIVDGDLEDVKNWLAQKEEGLADPNKRDYTGRAPLHLAVMSSTAEIVRCLVDAGARITARLADGRTALHLAAERGDADMIRILMEKSMQNEEEYEDQQSRIRAAKFGSGEAGGVKVVQRTKEVLSEAGDQEDVSDDNDEENSDVEVIDGTGTETDAVSMATGSFVKVKKDDDKDVGKDIVPEESLDDPDYYKPDVLSWDIPCSPLHFAIGGGHEEAVRALCEFGADSILPVKFLNSDKEPTNAILTLTLALTLPLEKAKSMARLLLKLGASSSQADLHGCTAFHRYVDHAETELIDTLWELDKTGVKAALNHLILGQGYWDLTAVSPLHTAIGNGDSILVMKLLEAGANPDIDFDSWLRAAKFNARTEKRLQSYDQNMDLYYRSVEQPLMVALRSCPDPEVAVKLLEGGADPNAMTQVSYQLLKNTYQRQRNKGESALDVVRRHIETLRKYTGETFYFVKPQLQDGMDEYLASLDKGSFLYWLASEDVKRKKKAYDEGMETYKVNLESFKKAKGLAEKKQAIAEALAGMERLEALLLEKGAKTFKELHPDIETDTSRNSRDNNQPRKEDAKKPYQYHLSFSNTTDVTEKRRKAYQELFEAAWIGDLERIKSFTTGFWDETQSEAPLKIAVKDNRDNSPLSLAFLRGHVEVAKAVLDIAEAQYCPAEKENKRFHMQESDDENDEDDEDADSDTDGGNNNGSEPRIVARKVDKRFTIENVGEISLQVKSRTRPLEMILWSCPTFKTDGTGNVTSCKEQGLLRFVLAHDDHAGLKTYLDWATHFASRKLEGDGDDEEAARRFVFPDNEFQWAVERGKTQMLAEIIKRTGAGIPLEHLVKKSGVEIKEKPRYYQGLSVYGKKRKDWANAGRNLVVRATGMKIPPLLHATAAVSIESVEWFLGDTPFRLYSEFGQSKAAVTDPKLKHLVQIPGAFDRAINRWLGAQNEIILHLAVTANPSEKANKLINYILQCHPETLETKNSDGETPLMIASFYGRIDFVKLLIAAGANQSVRNKTGSNIVHYALSGLPCAEQLDAFFALLDQDLLAHHLVTRTNLQDTDYRPGGMTPLHAFIHATAGADSYARRGGYKTEERWLDVVRLIVKYSGGAELQMLNGPGDTPLHTAVMQSCAPLVRALLDLGNPGLLHRENAVGRTPAEVARDRVTADKFKPPSPSLPALPGRGPMQISAGQLVDRPCQDFPLPVKPKSSSLSKSQSAKLATEEVWDVCMEYMSRQEASTIKRRLVSLNEANDVAKRLGEQYTGSRYFSIQAKDDDEEDGQGQEEDSKERDVADFSVQTKNARSVFRWLCDKCVKNRAACRCGEEQEKKSESSDLDS